MNWSDFEKYLKPVHLGGKARIVTIARIAIEETHPRPGVTEDSPVGYLAEYKQGLILSPTNRTTLIELFGDDVEACIGQKVVIKVVPLKVAGKEKTPVRIFKYTPQPEAQTGDQKQGPPEPPESTTNGERPYAPAVLKEKIAQRAVGSDPALPTHRRRLLSVLEQCFAGDEHSKRKALDVLNFLTGTASVEDLDGKIVAALTAWLAARSEDQVWIPSSLATEEAKMVWALVEGLNNNG